MTELIVQDAGGTITEMVKEGVALIEKGYDGVMILFDNGSYSADDIREIFARSDYPTK